MKHSRRQFLGAGLALPVLGAFGARSLAARRGRKGGSGKRVLVLGGTNFLGPAVVDAALERGFEVTLFNRGKSNPHLYPDLEKLVGDRDTGDLDALAEGEWDLVVDTSCYLPSHAEEAAAMVGDRIGQYVMISTCSVYADGDQYLVDENAPLGEISDEDVSKVQKIGDVYRVGGGRFYGPLKALSEQALEDLLPGRVTVLRPGVIAGRNDPSDRLPYWVVRTTQGGEILVPDAPDLGVQFTDVRDLGLFSIEFGEQQKSGIFNSIGFDGKVTLQELVHGCKIVLGANCSFTYVSEEFLLENQVQPFTELPFWLPPPLSHRFCNKQGLAAGMKFRPIAETIQETADWHFETRGKEYEWKVYGMKPAREADLLAKWHAKEAKKEPAPR
ncbi:MAG: epimerase [Planctomycetota bacterium]